MDSDVLHDGFVRACKNGCNVGLEVMLKSGKVDPCANSNAGLKAAIKKGMSLIFDILMMDPRVKASISYQEILEYAKECAQGSFILKYIEDHIQKEKMEKEKLDKDKIHERFLHYCNVGLCGGTDFGGRDGLTRWLTEVIPMMDSDVLHDGFVRACKNGCNVGLEVMLKSGKVDPCANSNAGLKAAIKKGMSLIFDILMMDPRVKASISYQEILEYAKECAQGSFILKSIEDYIKKEKQEKEKEKEKEKQEKEKEKQEKEENSRKFLDYCRTGQSQLEPDKLRDWLISVVPTLDDKVVNKGFAYACSSKANAMLITMLSTPSKIDPSANNNLALRKAAENGQVDLVRILLDDLRVLVNADALDHLALRWACHNGHAEVVKLIIEKTKPRLDNNNGSLCLTFAIRSGYTSVVEALLTADLVNATEIVFAVRSDRPEILRLLLKSTDPSPDQIDNCITEAVTGGFLECLSVLLDDDKVKGRVSYKRYMELKDKL